MPSQTTVFIVEIDQSTRQAMERLMRAGGLEAVCVDSVEALLELELPAGGAVIVVDLNAAGPLENRLHRALPLPVIYLTGCDSQQGRDEARQLGAAGYYRKPIDVQALTDAIQFAATQNAN